MELLGGSGLRRRGVAAVALLMCLAACRGRGENGKPSASAADSPASGAAAPAEPGTTKIDMEAIFPPGPGREIVLNACQNCHTFVPIVVLQMNEEAWTRNSRDHRMRVSAMSDADFALAYEYLKKTFNPGRPVPKLPPELLSSWTTS